MMNEELKKAIQMCTSDSSECDACPYLDRENCTEEILHEAMAALINMEETISLVCTLNNKLAEELRNSIGLTEGWDNLESES